MDAQRLERALEVIGDALDMLTAATGVDRFAALEEGRLPSDATLDVQQIYDLWRAVHDAYVAVTFAPGIPPFEVFATGRAGDPDSIMPTSLIPEAEEILRRAERDDRP